MNRLASLSVPVLSLSLSLSLACDPQEGPDYAGEPLLTMRGAVTSTEAPPSEAEAAILWLTGDEDGCEGPTLECGMEFTTTDPGADEACAEACGALVCEVGALESWTACNNACFGIEVDANIFLDTCATGGVGEQVALSVQRFPGTFEMALYDVPPEGGLLRGSDEGPRVGVAMIIALSADAPTVVDFETDPLESILGGVASHFIIYAADPVSADSVWGQFLGGAYEPGYQLVRVQTEYDCSNPLLGCFIASQSRSPEPLGFQAELELQLAPLDEIALPLL